MFWQLVSLWCLSLGAVIVCDGVEKGMAMPVKSRDKRSDDAGPLEAVVEKLAQRVTLLNAQLNQQSNSFNAQIAHQAITFETQLNTLTREIASLKTKTDQQGSRAMGPLSKSESARPTVMPDCYQANVSALTMRPTAELQQQVQDERKQADKKMKNREAAKKHRNKEKRNDFMIRQHNKDLESQQRTLRGEVKKLLRVASQYEKAVNTFRTSTAECYFPEGPRTKYGPTSQGAAPVMMPQPQYLPSGFNPPTSMMVPPPANVPRRSGSNQAGVFRIWVPGVGRAAIATSRMSQRSDGCLCECCNRTLNPREELWFRQGLGLGLGDGYSSHTAETFVDGAYTIRSPDQLSAPQQGNPSSYLMPSTLSTPFTSGAGSVSQEVPHPEGP